MTDDLSIPGFHIERRLGRGAHGTVFLARERDGLQRPVALKVFAPDCSPHYEQELAQTRRIEELRRSARVEQLVQSLGAGLHAGRGWIALEYLEDGSLQDVVSRDGPPPLLRALDYLGDAAAALAALHGQGLVHRDLKPGNLLLGSDGRVRLGDFGLSRGLDGTISSAGSASFAAPEVLADAVADWRRVDVYGLGATLAFLTTGQTMRPGHPDVFALETLGVPRGVQQLIVDAMALDPDQRPPDAEAFGATLAAVRRALEQPMRVAVRPRAASLAWPGALASQPPPSPPAPRLPVRLLLGALALAGAAGAVGWSYAARGTQPARSEEQLWASWRAAPEDAAPLAALVRRRLDALDAGGLCLLWAEAHRRLGDESAPGWQALVPSDVDTVAAALRDPGAPIRSRARAVLGAAMFDVAPELDALVWSTPAPLLREGAWASRLAHSELPPQVWRAWARQAAREGGAYAVLTLMEQAPRLQAAHLPGLASLAAAEDALLRASVPLATLCAALGADPAPAPERVAAVLEPLTADPVARVREVATRSLRARGLLAGLPGTYAAPELQLAGELIGCELLALPRRRREDLHQRWRDALTRRLQEAPSARLYLMRATEALRRGAWEQARADLADARREDPQLLEAQLLERLLRIVQEGADPGEPQLPPAEPAALEGAQRRLEFARVHGQLTLPGPNGLWRVVARFDRAAPRGFAVLPVPDDAGLPLQPRFAVVQTRFALSEVYAFGAHGRAPFHAFGTRLLLFAGPLGLTGEGFGAHTGRFAHVRVDGEVWARGEGPGPAAAVGLALSRGRLRACADGKVVFDCPLRPRRRRRSGPCQLSVFHEDGQPLERLTLLGRWDPSADRVAATSEPRAFAAGQPLSDERALVLAPNRHANGLDRLGQLRRAGVQLAARGLWLGDQQRAQCVTLRHIAGDFELRARLVSTGAAALGTGHEVGLALQGSPGPQEVLWFGLRGPDDTACVRAARQRVAVSQQQRVDWPWTLASQPWERLPLALSLQRRGDELFLRCGPDFDHLQPLLGLGRLESPFGTTVDAVLFGRSLGTAGPVVAFDQVEVVRFDD